MNGKSKVVYEKFMVKIQNNVKCSINMRNILIL